MGSLMARQLMAMVLGVTVWVQGLTFEPSILAWAALHGSTTGAWGDRLIFGLAPLGYNTLVLLGGCWLLELGAIGMMGRGPMATYPNTRPVIRKLNLL